MTIENEADLEGLRMIGRIVGQVLQQMIEQTDPGMTTLELDQLGEQLLAAAGARSAPRISYNFPGATCISVNEEAAHGIPGARVIQPGDMVNVDVSAEKGGYFADTGGSFAVPPVQLVQKRLLHATRRALERAMEATSAGKPLSVIGKSVQQVARKSGFKVIRDLCSHGVGRSLHESPTEIKGYFDPAEKRRLTDGLVITIEPFLSTRSRSVHQSADGWTLVGANGGLSAQFEHTLVVTRGKPLIMTSVS